MHRLSGLLPLFAALACAALIGAAPAPSTYVPQAQFCHRPATTHGPVINGLCPTIPGNIGPDPLLDQKIAYNGIVGAHPASPATDVQTPFDNLSWQTFVALNWTRGKENRPAREGLNGKGERVWQGFPRVSQVFGNSKVQANCNVPPGYEVFSIASQGDGQPATRNEEYIQAATGDPAIDVNGNWTLYERRVNGIEIAYLKAPDGKRNWNLTTLAGQFAFAENNAAVNFPAAGGGRPNGAMEIKAAWRILDPARHVANQKRFYVIRAIIAVAPDLVFRGAKRPAPICAPVDLGLVAMHIIQKNPTTTNDLKPEWFWSTFEQVDNAPLAADACDPASPSTCGTLGKLACPAGPPLLGAPDYSYFNARYPNLPTNQPPQLLLGGKAFLWNPVQPYAFSYLTPAGGGAKAGTQIARCWKIYAMTEALNTQWRAELRKVGSVFANYMLVGTQWGASTTATPNRQIPTGGVPNFLSNSVVETYLQTLADPNNPFGNGSCISCHSAATLLNNTTPANLSFLPDLVNLLQVRRPALPPHP
ncbi:MAG: hypothetical protein WDN01_13220 [Rhizomicrobium sp.]